MKRSANTPVARCSCSWTPAASGFPGATNSSASTAISPTLAKSLEVARRAGHRIVSLVYDEAVSGGFLSFGLMADAVFALPTANVRVMALPAMARVTKLPRERLEELARVSPVFAPGVENYVALGGVRALWPVDAELPGRLAAALAPEVPTLDLPPLARRIVGRVLAAA